MIPTEELYDMVEREGIVLDWREMKGYFLGIYLYDPILMAPCIVLNYDLQKREKLFRCVLAHELGHHFCTTGQRVFAAGTTALYHVCKHEKLATEWAVTQLVPVVPFLKLLNRRFDFEELVEYFNVVPEFITYRARKIYENGLVTPEVRHCMRSKGKVSCR